MEITSFHKIWLSCRQIFMNCCFFFPLRKLFKHKHSTAGITHTPSIETSWKHFRKELWGAFNWKQKLRYFQYAVFSFSFCIHIKILDDSLLYRLLHECDIFHEIFFFVKFFFCFIFVKRGFSLIQSCFFIPFFYQCTLTMNKINGSRQQVIWRNLKLINDYYHHHTMCSNILSAPIILMKMAKYK